jgi:steroid 5-alpha reductase family enzyme
MSFFQIYFQAFLVIMIMMSVLWFISVILRNASIVDIFWGAGFVVASAFYFFKTGTPDPRRIIMLTLVSAWGLRLSAYLAWRNAGKGEDFRYRNFRKKYGENRYWWISFFQVFLLQGILMWLISAPLLGAQFYEQGNQLNILDYTGIALWLIGFIFEAGGDYQLARFRSDPANKGKVLESGFWRYTRHPNYFGDSAVWWGYGLICLAAGNYIAVLGSVMMTALIIKVSGVAMLERSLKEQKPQYREYIEKTSAFFPWFPK